MQPLDWQISEYELSAEYITEVDEDEPSPECSIDIVENPECSAVLCKSSSKSKHSLLAAMVNRDSDTFNSYSTSSSCHTKHRWTL